MNKINTLLILTLLSCPLWGQASTLTAQLDLIKIALIDNQGQLVQGGLVKGNIQLNENSEQLVWAALKLPIGFIPGHVFQTGDTWMLEVPLTPPQITLFDKFAKDEQFYLLAVEGEYRTLENAPGEVVFHWAKILAHLTSHQIKTIADLQHHVDLMLTSGAIQTAQPLNNMAKKAMVFTLRRQLFEYYQMEGQLAIRLHYPIPPLSKPIKTRLHHPVYIERTRFFRVEIKPQPTEEVVYDAYRLQTVQFYTAIDLKLLGIRAIALQSEMVDSQGYRQPGKVLLIKNEPFVFYQQTFIIIGAFNQYHLVYWGAIFLENGTVLDLPKTHPKTFAISNSTQELSRIVSPLITPEANNDEIFDDDDEFDEEFDDED
jgi:hypothetical protein